jgi:N-acyl homoserine lactone hydrolase
MDAVCEQMSSPEIIHLRLDELVAPGGHPNAGGTIPVMGSVVLHPGGVLLVDTGIGDPHPEIDEVFRPTRRPFEEALTSAGVDREEVAAIVNCHLHFDHCGGNRSLPGVATYVQRAELEASRDPGYTIPEWVEFPGARYVQLDGEAEILPGVRVIRTPGHSPGHQSTVLDTESGPVLLAGQAFYTSAEWEGVTDPRASGLESAWDADAYAESTRRLRAIDPIRVYFGHDTAPWDKR